MDKIVKDNKGKEKIAGRNSDEGQNDDSPVGEARRNFYNGA